MTGTIHTTRDLTIRLSTPADEPALIRLAQLDSTQPFSGTDVLIAEEDGEVVAAKSQGDGKVVANPFRHTAATVALLGARAAALQSPPPGDCARLRRVFRPAFATHV